MGDRKDAVINHALLGGRISVNRGVLPKPILRRTGWGRRSSRCSAQSHTLNVGRAIFFLLLSLGCNKSLNSWDFSFSPLKTKRLC